MKKILILGSYGRGNVGDDAFLYVATKLFEKSKLFINSANDNLLPKDLQNKFTTINTAGGSDFIKKLSIFLSITHVVYCGGDLWVELYGDKYPRQSLYKMAILNIALRMFGKKIAYIGCGVGRIKGFSLWLAKISAGLASLIIVREKYSQETLGFKKIKVLPDLTINLFPKRNLSPKKTAKKHLVENIGISVMYYIPNPKENYSKYKKDIANLISSLLAIRESRKIKLIPMLLSEESYDDLKVCEEIYQEIPFQQRAQIEILRYNSFNEFLENIALLDLVIGTRLHANILATLSGVPSIGIAYRNKVRSFFHQIDMEENCVDLNSIDRIPAISTHIEEHYHAFLRRLSIITEKMAQKKVAYEDLVQKFFK